MWALWITSCGLAHAHAQRGRGTQRIKKKKVTIFFKEVT